MKVIRKIFVEVSDIAVRIMLFIFTIFLFSAIFTFLWNKNFGTIRIIKFNDCLSAFNLLGIVIGFINSIVCITKCDKE